MGTKGQASSFFTGFLIGGLIGAATALILAPQSGEETRTQIREKSIELKDKAETTYADLQKRLEATVADLQKKYEALAADVRQKVDEVSAKVDEVVAQGKEKVTKVAKKEGKEPAKEEAAAG